MSMSQEDRAAAVLRALEESPQLLGEILPSACQTIHPDIVVEWLFTAQLRWRGVTPIEKIAQQDTGQIAQMLRELQLGNELPHGSVEPDEDADGP
jgi:hypothetical protein